jgi:hypothetical protein
MPKGESGFIQNIVAPTTADSRFMTPDDTIIKTVAASGTPEAVSATQVLVRSALFIGRNAARTNNTGNVYIGWQSADDTQLLEVTPGAEVRVTAPDGEAFDLGATYVDVITNDDGVVVIYS